VVVEAVRLAEYEVVLVPEAVRALHRKRLYEAVVDGEVVGLEGIWAHPMPFARRQLSA
jgi:hypothetical protein